MNAYFPYIIWTDRSTATVILSRFWFPLDVECHCGIFFFVFLNIIYFPPALKNPHFRSFKTLDTPPQNSNRFPSAINPHLRPSGTGIQFAQHKRPISGAVFLISSVQPPIREIS
ncbi:hypothetical protein I3842_Q053000 [Carya illinoinensis]|uniref:Uncharacterized protein n=1 Tax=Carya illinoinensis TaxID=32201 RepID=A0A922D355_CARIL|nr:hypothetical protein I3842_Q053000 [Carya illinoinensis]KAG6620683.1 hypothetical protein I3842_Q053000 [Carya illinoinensis]KAG6620684.1 hypothetical protein I3842_Q053000 [Carya illinoinensis]KAG6620685.1 hypothetical protein I3842_Q053000 [Carya illinoinensis]KAG6620686.1 hypothetical protein I3842_Q053000 [Carya illinoinensis]